VGTPVFVFLLVLALLLALVLLVQIYWNSPELRRLAMWSASRLGPEPWLSRSRSVPVWLQGLLARSSCSFEPNIAAPTGRPSRGPSRHPAW
jgi:hypothetical protein